MTITNHSQNKPNKEDRISALKRPPVMQHDFLRFPRNLPIIYLERHIVIGQLFLPNIVLVRASLVSLVLLQQEVTHRLLNLVSKSNKTNLSVFSQDSQTQVYEKAWVN